MNIAQGGFLGFCIDVLSWFCGLILFFGSVMHVFAGMFLFFMLSVGRRLCVSPRDVFDFWIFFSLICFLFCAIRYA